MDSRAGISLVLVLALLFAFYSAQARSLGKDLGVHGKLYEIKEEDMLSYVLRKTGEIDMQALRESMEKKFLESYAEQSLVSLYVPVVTEEKVRYIDPSVVVRNPLYDHTGRIIFPAGVINPLDYVSISKSILVLREDQIERAVEKTAEDMEKPILILTDGDIKKASLIAGQVVYKASPFVLRRLQIEKAPSLVTQEGKQLKIREIVLE